jgi:nucleoid-associated protein YgaU
MHLGPGATDGEIAAAWPQWHAANRTVIGNDPDLVLPGQILTIPAALGGLR